MKLVGYVDRWSGTAGDTFTFHVSCELPRYRAQLVRLIHGDPSPAGPGIKEEAIASTLEGEYQGGVQEIPLGSCMRVDGLPALGSLTIAAWIWPTVRKSREQCLASRGEGERGWKLQLNATGEIELCVHSRPGPMTITLDGPLPLRAWTFVAGVISHDGQMRLYRAFKDYSPSEPRSIEVAGDLGAGFSDAAHQPLLIGAERLEPVGRGARPQSVFNGKVSAPLLFDRALQSSELQRLANADPAVVPQAIARWDFVARAATVEVPDTSGNGFHGTTVNRPGRLMAGHNFSGRTSNPLEQPDEFNAVHFHEDDLADAGWKPAFHFQVPEGLRSGIYAAKITGEGHEDHIPFVVRASRGQPRAAVAFLLPTVSYMAYANSGMEPSVMPEALVPLCDPSVGTSERAYCRSQGLRSLYDVHTDGSGVSIATMLRPMTVNVRPGSRSLWNGGAHQLGADLHMIDWLEAKGIAYDVLTDHDIDKEGASALAPYGAVISGTHAEYWTSRMLDALLTYQNQGGRFVYLSGNGLYWVTALSEDQTLVEIRRARGTRSWTAAPGEEHLSLTGEPGGLWRDRDRAPQRYVGVGFASQGFDLGRPYRRLPASHDPRARFIFEGVGDEWIGDFPVLVSGQGAAGFEVDRADPELGTPAHALVLATASGFSDCYQGVVEEAPGMTPLYGGTTCDSVRADMTFYETPGDGAVFSVGSISWCSALSFNNYENNVSRITENVIRAFARPGPLPRL